MSIDDKSITKWLRAAGEGRLESVQKLIEQGFDVNLSNNIGATALMSAARSYRSEIVVFLLELGANANAQTNDGRTVLHGAVGETPSLPEKQAECVRLLLKAGANADAVTSSGSTPLMNAAWFGCIASVREFVKHGVNVRILDAQGRTAKDLANVRGHHEIVQILETYEQTN